MENNDGISHQSTPRRPPRASSPPNPTPFSPHFRQICVCILSLHAGHVLEYNIIKLFLYYKRPNHSPLSYRLRPLIRSSHLSVLRFGLHPHSLVTSELQFSIFILTVTLYSCMLLSWTWQTSPRPSIRTVRRCSKLYARSLVRPSSLFLHP